MAHLWDTLNQDENDKTQENNIPVYTGNELAEKSLNEVIAYDMNNENVLFSDTVVLKTSLGFCEQIFEAVYKVADYVPDLSDDEHLNFWKEDVIPNLVDCLQQHARARSITIQAFGAIRDLGITIKTAADIVKDTRGSPEAVKIAQKNVPGALKTLDQFITEASTLNDSAFQTFSTQTNKILMIIGPKAADFVKQKVDIECELKCLYEKQNELCTKLGEKQGEVSRYNYLIQATGMHLKCATQELAETKRRTDELNRLNAEIEEKIQNNADETNNTSISILGIGFSFKSKKNADDREADKKYYESVILSRMERVREERNDEAAQQEVMKVLNDCFSEYKSKYEKAMKELENMNNDFYKQKEDIQKQIKNLYDKADKIDKQEVNTHNTIGLHGNTLIKCLVSIRTFAETIGGGASAYAPLVSILKGIKAMVQNDVELLSSTTPLHVFIAGNRLLKQVQFLSNYSIGAQPILRDLQASAHLNYPLNAIE